MPQEPNPQPNDEVIEEIVNDDDQQPVDIPDDGNVQPAVAASVPVAAGAAADVDDEQFGRLTPREKALVEKARAQEKTKLYAKINAIESRLRELQQGGGNPPPATPRSNQSQGTRSVRDREVESLSQQLTDLNNKLRQQELRVYRKDKIDDLRRRNVGFVESLVNGDSEEVIDASIQLAMAEHAMMENEFKTRYNVGGNGGAAPEPVPAAGARPAPIVIRQSAPRRPDGVPTVRGAEVSGDSSNSISTAEITDMTSWEAIRNGTYAANRDRIHAAVRTGRIRRQS